MEPLGRPASFIVRASLDESRRFSGIVERVRTGGRHQFLDASAIGPIIVRTPRAAEPRDSGPPGTEEERG